MRPGRAVAVRRLRADEAALFRTLRLRALADAPDAFADRHDHIRTRPGAYWDEMTRSVTDPDRHAMFVAEVGSGPIGLAFGLVDRERAGPVHLGGMWVAPEARGRGAGRALGEAVLTWALARGFREAVLWVTEGNTAAITLYERLGFAATGRRDRLPSNVGLQTIEMRLALPAGTR